MIRGFGGAREASQLLRRKLKVDLLTQIPRKFEDLTPISPRSEGDESLEQPFQQLRESQIDDFLSMPHHQSFVRRTSNGAKETKEEEEEESVALHIYTAEGGIEESQDTIVV